MRLNKRISKTIEDNDLKFKTDDSQRATNLQKKTFINLNKAAKFKLKSYLTYAVVNLKTKLNSLQKQNKQSC